MKDPERKEEIRLTDRHWEFFGIPQLFKVKPGKYYYPAEYSDGNVPYISATNVDNGISCLIDIDPDFRGNVITNEKVNCCAFYQPVSFCATSDVNVLTPLEGTRMNPFIGLFIATVINFNENYRWNYGRQCRKNDTEKIRIRLPVTENGTPDWTFMEDYIKSLPYSL